MTTSEKTFQRVHIVNDGNPSWMTEVSDAETGERIEGVSRVELVFDTSKHIPTAVVHTILPRVDVVVEAEMRQSCPMCGRKAKDEEQQPPEGEGLMYVSSEVWESVGKPETPEAWHAALLLPDTYTVQSVGLLPDGRYTLRVAHDAIPSGIGAYVLPEIVPFYGRDDVNGEHGTPYLMRVEIRQWNKETGWQTVAITDERKETNDEEGSTGE